MLKFKLSGLLLVASLALHNNWSVAKFLEPRIENWGNDLTNVKLGTLLPLIYAAKANSKSFNGSQICPADLKTLVTLLMRDLPSYANREIQKARRLDRTVDQFSYVIVAGNQEFEPLPLSPSQSPSTPSSVENDGTKQVFFTTLERRYREGKAVESQNFYRIFLTETPEGWRLVMIFSRLGSTSGQRPPTPPRESSNSAVGQAIKTWLRDCRAGTLR